jgi:putative membrane protein
MTRFVVRLLINAVALWLTTLLVSGVTVTPYGAGGALETIVTFLLLALVFGIVNGVVGTAIRVVAFPLYILTLGLIALVVNGLLLLIVAWISGLFGFGLTVDGFWWGVLGAVVLAVFAWAIGVVVRPVVGRGDRQR